MNLDERIQTEGLRVPQKGLETTGPEDPHDEQDGRGFKPDALIDLDLVDQEVLPQDGQARGAGQRKIRRASPEEVLIGETRDRGGSSLGIRARRLRRVESRGKVSLRRRPSLDLGDH